MKKCSKCGCDIPNQGQKALETFVLWVDLKLRGGKQSSGYMALNDSSEKLTSDFQRARVFYGRSEAEGVIDWFRRGEAWYGAVEGLVNYRLEPVIEHGWAASQRLEKR